MDSESQALDLDFDNLPDYFRAVGKASPSRPVLGFQDPNSESGAGFRLYTAVEILDLANVAQRYYDTTRIQLPSTTNGESDDPVAAIAAYGNVNWAATFIALVRLGFTVLVLSPRLSNEALEALLRKTNTTTFVYGDHIEPNLFQDFNATPIISIEELEKGLDFQNLESFPGKQLVAKTGFIWHSSGTTGLPKTFPISQTVAVARVKSAKNTVAQDQSMWITSSLYNSAGLTFFLAALTKSAITFFWDDSRPYTSERLANFLEAADPHTTIFAPAMLAQLTESDKGLQILKGRQRVSTFGAVCPKALGDDLTAKGVRISTGYAMSETSTLMHSAVRPPDDNDWDYMAPLPSTKPFIHMQPFVKGKSASGEGEIELYEGVILQGYPNTPASMSNSNDPPGSFHTGDVFEKHPSKSDRWRIVGRKDDQINMGIPVVISAFEYEEAIKLHLGSVAVEEVVVFGNGRLALGVLVFIQPEQQAEMPLIRKAAWKAVQKGINGKMKVPIEEGMVLIVDEKVPRTDKGNFARPLIYRQYDDQINRAYATGEQDGRL